MKLVKYASVIMAAVSALPAMAQVVDPTVALSVPVTSSLLSSRFVNGVTGAAASVVVDSTATPAASHPMIHITAQAPTKVGVQQAVTMPSTTPPAGPRWYAMSFMVPADPKDSSAAKLGWAALPTPVTVAEIDATTSATSSVNPPVSLVITRGNFELLLSSKYISPTAQSTTTSELMRVGPVKAGTWYCMVVRSDWSPALAVGSLQIWLNGDRIFETLHTTASFAASANIPKLGLTYNYATAADAVSRQIYTDIIRSGTDIVHPALSTATPFIPDPGALYNNTPCSGVVVQRSLNQTS